MQKTTIMNWWAHIVTISRSHTRIVMGFTDFPHEFPVPWKKTCVIFTFPAHLAASSGLDGWKRSPPVTLYSQLVTSSGLIIKFIFCFYHVHQNNAVKQKCINFTANIGGVCEKSTRECVFCMVRFLSRYKGCRWTFLRGHQIRSLSVWSLYCPIFLIQNVASIISVIALLKLFYLFLGHSYVEFRS